MNEDKSCKPSSGPMRPCLKQTTSFRATNNECFLERSKSDDLTSQVLELGPKSRSLESSDVKSKRRVQICEDVVVFEVENWKKTNYSFRNMVCNVCTIS